MKPEKRLEEKLEEKLYELNKRMEEEKRCNGGQAGTTQ